MIINLWVGPESVKVSIEAAENFHKQLKRAVTKQKGRYERFAFQEPIAAEYLPIGCVSANNYFVQTVTVPMDQLNSIIDHVGLQIERSKKKYEKVYRSQDC